MSRKIPKIHFICHYCGVIFLPKIISISYYKKHPRYCCLDHRNKHILPNHLPPQGKGDKCPRWKSGKIITTQGYYRIFKPEWISADKDGYVTEHKFLVEKLLKRKLKTSETIHHINGDKKDNRLKNLYLFSNKAQHASYHHNKKSKIIIMSNLF